MCLIKTAHRGWVNISDGKVCSNSNKLEGVFRPQSYEDACAETAVRAEVWCKTFLHDNSNGFPATSLFERTHVMRGAFDEPI